MVECTALEMRRAFAGTVGSNPTLSATAPPPATSPPFKGRNAGRRPNRWLGTALRISMGFGIEVQ